MDFSLTEEQEAFRQMVRRWVDAEAPKDLMRRLEADEENYPFPLWDKLKEQGFFGIGIDEDYGGQGGDVMTQMIFARELARTAGGLIWTWGVTYFAGAKSVGLYGTPEQKEMAQDALNRWWWPSLMMFGPSDANSPHSAESMKWKIKRQSNDELRQIFIDRTVQQAEVIGLSIPDPALKWNEATKHYDWGEIDWTEFYNVISGNGPCNKERLAARNKAHDERAWVREAALAHAAKKAKKRQAA